MGKSITAVAVRTFWELSGDRRTERLVREWLAADGVPVRFEVVTTRKVST